MESVRPDAYLRFFIFYLVTTEKCPGLLRHDFSPESIATPASPAPVINGSR